MPLLPFVQAGADLLGSILNSTGQARQNAASLAFAREMYERQKTDNLAFWNLQNDYNSPANQMARFKAAGLNPNLIYGQGNAGNAGSLSAPSTTTPQFQNTRPGDALTSLSALSAIYDLDIKAAQVDNLRAQNSVILQDAVLRAAQVASTTTGTEKTQFDLDFLRDTRSISLEAKREALRQLRTNIDLSISQNARDAVKDATSVQEAITRMGNMVEQRKTMQVQRAHTRADIQRIRTDVGRIREATQNLRQDSRLKQLDIDLRKQGINPHDPMWARIVGRLIQKFFGDYLEDVR